MVRHANLVPHGKDPPPQMPRKYEDFPALAADCGLRCPAVSLPPSEVDGPGKQPNVVLPGAQFRTRRPLGWASLHRVARPRMMLLRSLCRNRDWMPRHVRRMWDQLRSRLAARTDLGANRAPKTQVTWRQRLAPAQAKAASPWLTVLGIA